MNWCLSPDLLETIVVSKSDSCGFEISNTINKRKSKAFPEEIIRHLMFSRLVNHYHFNPKLIYFEFPIQMGSTKKRADLTVTDNNKNPIVIIEVKIGIKKSSIKQLHSYLQATSAKYGILVDDNNTLFYEKSINNKIFEVNEINVGCFNYTNDIHKNEDESDSFGINGLVKEMHENNSEEWFIISGDVQFNISLKDLQNYNRVQSIALESGKSLLNYNPTPVEWKNTLHSLIQNCNVVKKQDKIKQKIEYSFIKDIALLMVSKKINNTYFFSYRRDGNYNFAFNSIYTEYEKYKSIKSEPPVSKKLILRFLKDKNIVTETSVTCNINGRCVRGVIMNAQNFPTEINHLLNNKP